uniref:Cornichon family protein n=1 Tax=Solanum tuberosum TaxID=4113 RepID=M1AYU9_SOLTU
MGDLLSWLLSFFLLVAVLAIVLYQVYSISISLHLPFSPYLMRLCKSPFGLLKLENLKLVEREEKLNQINFHVTT